MEEWKIRTAVKSYKTATTKSNNNDTLTWPSERIPQGGVFHSPKIVYSQETADLLKLLMEESKMSMSMRRKIHYHLRNNEPLPLPELRPINTSIDVDTHTLEILERARKAKRKSLKKIMASGVYDMPSYRPKPDNRISSDKDKKQLQAAMSGLNLSETTQMFKRKVLPKNETETTHEDIINELLAQIEERAQWLAEMEALGEGKKYHNEIRGQIAERLERIKQLEVRIKMRNEGIRYVE